MPLDSPFGNIWNRSPFGGGGDNWFDAYKREGSLPAMVASFFTGKYYNAGVTITFGSLLTPARTEAKPAWLANGDIGWSGHNLLSGADDLTDAKWTVWAGSAVIDDFETIIFTANSGDSVNNKTQDTTIVVGAEYTGGIEIWSDTDVGEGVSIYINWRGAGQTTDVDLVLTSSPTLVVTLGDDAPVGATGFDFVIRNSADSLAKTIKVRNARAYRSSGGGMQPNLDTPATPTYYPTTSAAYFAPAIAYNPVTLDNEGRVLEPEITRQNTDYECKDGTGWTAQGSPTLTNTALGYLGVFGGVTVESGGEAWHTIKEVGDSSVVAASVYPVTFIAEEGTSGEFRFVLGQSGTGNETQVTGAAGSLSATVTTAGSVSDIVERLLPSGELLVTMYHTPNHSGAVKLKIGPNAASGTVIALAAFIGGAGEKLPHCPIIGDDGSTETVTKDLLSFEAVPSEIELVTNGGFDTDADWVLTQSIISDGVVSFITTGTYSQIESAVNVGATTGRSYQVTYDITAFTSSGNIRVKIGTDSTERTISGTGSFVETIVATADGKLNMQTVGGNNLICSIDNISVQELVPFVGYDADQGTWVLKGRWAYTGGTNYMLVGDTATRLIYQNSSDIIKAYDGTNTVKILGSHTDGVNTAVVMSYESGGNLDIVVDGSAEDGDPLSGDLAATSIDIGQLAGASSMHGVVSEIIYYPVKLGLTTRQGFEAIPAAVIAAILYGLDFSTAENSMTFITAGFL